MIRRREILTGGAGALTLAGLGLGSARAAPSEVVVGVLYAMSGANAQVGVDARHAIETALDIVNNDHDLDLPNAKGTGLKGLGGAKIRLVFADHQSDPQKGRAEAERLITQDKVSAIVGCYQSAVSSTVSATCERYGVPFVCADSSSPSLHRKGLKFFFRPAAHDEMFSAAMFDFMDAMRNKGEKIDSVALFFEDTIFGVDSSTVQRKLAGERGYKIASDIKYKTNSPSLTAEVQQIKTANADVLLPSCYTTDAILLTRTMAELGYKPKSIIAQASGFSEKATFDAVGDKLQGLISRASFSLDLAAKRPMIKTVNDMYKARAGRDLNDNTSRQFMALIVLADALDRAGSVDGPKIRDALAATNIPGERTIMPWSKVAFGPDGQNVNADPVLLQYVGTQFVTVFPEAVAVSPAKWPMNA
ncbi:ABC transporter substrate-binding protein [uncultured Methylobacterium sp.]|jgi:branched-chain amino acid transport system substrate-binding protein|uniref:ABC transporter substrate-binding protein n=1 Tax=uncultured Methylobacterium sp. TaxID=157278 RepID=UPI002603722F|nr:ABC transporter substrate-binding protein [uncultured Methylobacterium sp.]